MTEKENPPTDASAPVYIRAATIADLKEAAVHGQPITVTIEGVGVPVRVTGWDIRLEEA